MKEALPFSIQKAEVHALREQQQHRNNKVTEASRAQDNNIQVEAENLKEKHDFPPDIPSAALETSKRRMAVELDLDPTQKTKEDLEATDRKNTATSIHDKPQDSQQSQTWRTLRLLVPRQNSKRGTIKQQ